MIDILDWLGLNDIPVIEEKKKRVVTIYKDTLKIERKTKEKRDFVDKQDLFKKIKRYKILQRMNHRGTIQDENKIEFKFLRDYLILKYREVAKKLTNHSHFRNYTTEEKEDMIAYAIIRALGIGIQGRSNYGVEYFVRFDPEKHDNVFSFWTQVVKCFFYQYLNNYYGEKNVKQVVLQSMIDQFEYDAKEIHGCPGAQFQLADGMDSED
ncbi:MAG TPA: hypothetical protein PLW61_06285 [Caldisericia bacterium]|nr:hypothetical protein [Caldisericia bacterium]